MLRQRNRERAPKEFCISLSFSPMTLLTSIGSRRNHCKHHSNTALQWESHAGKCVLALVPKPYSLQNLLLTVCRICCLQYAEFVAYSVQNLLLTVCRICCLQYAEFVAYSMHCQNLLLTVCRICCLQYDVLAFFPGLPWLQFFIAYSTFFAHCN